MSRRSGRSRQKTILRAARREFARSGYDQATLRAIARRAGCDAALISHYFGTKAALFEEAMDIWGGTSFVMPSAEETDSGESLVRTYLRAWESGEARLVALGLLRPAVGSSRTAARARDLLMAEMLRPVARDPRLATIHGGTSLAGASLVGLLVARDVVRLEPLASIEVECIAAAVGPMMDHYISVVEVSAAASRTWQGQGADGER